MRRIHHFLSESIAYELVGKGPTLVFIHGFLGSKNCFRPLVQRLKKQFQILSFDLPGHGESNSIGYVHDMEMLADLLKSLLDRNRLRRIYLVGHSLGGYVSLAFGEKYPDHIKGLILLNSTASADLPSRIKSRNQLIALLKKDRNRAIQALIPSFFQGESRKSKRLIGMYEKEAQRCSTRGIIASIEGMKKRAEREIVLKFAPYPYWIIIGEEDPVLDLDQQLAQASLSEMGEAIILKGTAHMSYLEVPGKVYDLIKQFARVKTG